MQFHNHYFLCLLFAQSNQLIRYSLLKQMFLHLDCLHKLSISVHPKLDDLSTYDHYQPVYKKTYLFGSLEDLFQLTDNYYLDFLKNLILQENL